MTLKAETPYWVQAYAVDTAGLSGACSEPILAVPLSPDAADGGEGAGTKSSGCSQSPGASEGLVGAIVLLALGSWRRRQRG